MASLTDPDTTPIMPWASPSISKIRFSAGAHRTEAIAFSRPRSFSATSASQPRFARVSKALSSEDLCICRSLLSVAGSFGAGTVSRWKYTERGRLGIWRFFDEVSTPAHLFKCEPPRDLPLFAPAAHRPRTGWVGLRYDRCIRARCGAGSACRFPDGMTRGPLPRQERASRDRSIKTNMPFRLNFPMPHMEHWRSEQQMYMLRQRQDILAFRLILSPSGSWFNLLPYFSKFQGYLSRRAAKSALPASGTSRVSQGQALS